MGSFFRKGIFLLLVSLVTIAVFVYIGLFAGRDHTQDISLFLDGDIGTIQMAYGANEDDNWMLFAKDPEIASLHKGVSSQYIRVLLSSPWFRESTIPLQDDGTYDFANADSLINAVLSINAVPFITFAHAPGIRAEAHGESPPKDDDAFVEYVRTVVGHYQQACRAGQLSKPCDVNEWYFEIWNEPYPDAWWEDDPPRYSRIFNAAQERINQIAPLSKVGGYSGTFVSGKDRDRLQKFLDNSRPDFITLHHYGNILHTGEKERMQDVKYLSYDSILSLAAFLEGHSSQGIEIIEGEYSADYRKANMPHLDEQMTAAWYASALIWQIKSQKVSLELFYSGTSNQPDGGFGLWSLNSDASVRWWPTYQMKSQFVRYNKGGSAILDAESDDDSLAVLAIRNEEGTFITLVNKLKKTSVRTVALQTTNFNQIVDVSTAQEYPIVDGIVGISLQPYEMRIFRLTQ